MRLFGFSHCLIQIFGARLEVRIVWREIKYLREQSNIWCYLALFSLIIEQMECVSPELRILAEKWRCEIAKDLSFLHLLGEKGRNISYFQNFLKEWTMKFWWNTFQLLESKWKQSEIAPNIWLLSQIFDLSPNNSHLESRTKYLRPNTNKVGVRKGNCLVVSVYLVFEP